MRVLVAGLGAVGQRHARNLRTLFGDDVQLLAYRSRGLSHVITEALERDDSRDVERELGMTAFYDLDAALAARPDAALVCTPSNQHVAVAQRCAAAGCHVFIEKPLADSLDGVERLRETVVSKRLVAAVGCQWRFHPCVRWLRETLRAGTLGRLVHADIEYAEYLPDWHPYEDYRTSYAARAQLGGGVILTQIHDYDLAWWLFGPPTRAKATGGHLSALEIDVEDTVDAELEGGAVPVRVRQCFASRPPRRMISVVGEHGSVRVDLLGARIVTDLSGVADVTPQGYQRNQMFIDEIREFFMSVTEHTQPDVPLDDGIAVLRLALAVRDAMRTGMEISLS